MKTRPLWRYRSAWKFLRIQSFQSMENMFSTYKQRHLKKKRKIQYLLLLYCELPFTCLIVLLQASTMLPTCIHLCIAGSCTASRQSHLGCSQSSSQKPLEPFHLPDFSWSHPLLVRLTWVLDPLRVKELIFVSLPTSFLPAQMTGKEVQMI